MDWPKDLADLASPPLFVQETASVKEAAQLMQRHHVGSLVVTGPAGEAVGLVTDRDLAFGAMMRPSGTPAPLVQSVASRPLLTLPLDSTLPEVTCFLGAHCVRRVGLMAEDGTIQAVLSSDALLMHIGLQIHWVTNTIGRELEEERNPTERGGSRFGQE